MGEFDDLFDRGIPEEDVQEYLVELHKLATCTFAPQHKLATAEQVLQEHRDLERAARAMDAVLYKVADLPTDKQIRQWSRDAAKPSTSYGVNTAAGAIGGAIAGMATAAMVAPDRFQRAAAVGALLGATQGLLRTANNRGHERDDRERGKRAADDPILQQAPVAMGQDPNAPAPEQVILAEQQGLLAQTSTENEALRGELQQSQAEAQQKAMEAEQAAMESQQLQQQLAEAQQAAEAQTAAAAQQMQMAQQQAQEAQMQAQMQAQQAAQHADAKMRLSIRIQQMRQQLAEMASQDPAAEEGESGVPAIQTPAQQGAAAGAVDPNTGMPVDPNAAVDPNTGAPVDPNAAAAQPQPAQAAPAQPAAPKPKAEAKKTAALQLLRHARLIKQASGRRY